MKKMLIVFLTLLIVLLCSCSKEYNMSIMKTDRDIANEKFEEILEAIQSKDRERITSVFSKNALNKAESFAESVTELFNYFDGIVKSYDDWGALYVEDESKFPEYYQKMESTYDVKTTECEYRFAIIHITEDTTNDNNIGVTSLYIIKKEDDTDLQYAYWGDGNDTPGINIGIKNIE